MKRWICVSLVLSLLLLSFSCKSSSRTKDKLEDEEAWAIEDEAFYMNLELPPEGAELPVSTFGEIWAYVVAGRESSLIKGLPITDIGYFGAEVDSYGALCDVPSRKKLSAFSGRVHLVVCCNGRALSHFVLKPGSPERKALIADILAATKDYDGLQIDFENIPKQDVQTYFSFLQELRAGLGNKMFTVALAARNKKLENDQYDYERIAPIVDRILVMAYDQHWSGSNPGSIADLAWCKRVADYSLAVVGKEKLVMGLPFYGRAWASPGHAMALGHGGIERVIKENRVSHVKRENGIPTFDYEAPIKVKVYYEDEYSLSARMEIYRTMGITSIGFWRMGLETDEVWKLIKLGK